MFIVGTGVALAAGLDVGNDTELGGRVWFLEKVSLGDDVGRGRLSNGLVVGDTVGVRVGVAVGPFVGRTLGANVSSTGKVVVGVAVGGSTVLSI